MRGKPPSRFGDTTLDANDFRNLQSKMALKGALPKKE